VVETSNPVDTRDARILLLGVEGQFLDRRPEPEVEPEPEVSDRDQDGIPDESDACPDDPEDIDGFEDEDGCPDPDNDEDGILDEVDECPDEPEDVDGFADEDGCPDLDNDQDGFQDVVDECPNDAEVVNGVDDHDGCPDEGVIEFVDDRIVLEERVLFETDRARVRSAGRVMLRAVMHLWRQHPEWTRVQIQGHADVRGEAEYNRQLSDRRARAVRRVLIDVGASDEQLEAVGLGSSQPRDRRRTQEAYQRNRRVEFVVINDRPNEAPAESGGDAPEPVEGSAADSGGLPADEEGAR
jgi:outer membrane protein OmpA-like peptidoglycan-associated protein